MITFTEGGNGHDVGQRVPALWVYGSGQLYPAFAVNGHGNYPDSFASNTCSLGKWHSVEFSQSLKNDKHMFRVVVDGEDVIISVENTKPRTFSNVKMFAANNFHHPLQGSIKNLLINTDSSGVCGG